VAQLAHGLRDLGVTRGDRVATFMWNNQEHLDTYFAAPSMGAVLHTLNIRLAREQIAFIANHAEDSVVLVDMSLVSLLAPVLAEMTTVHTVVAVGSGDLDVLAASGKDVIRYDDLVGGRPLEYDWPDLDEKSAAAMCYTSGTTGNPKGVVYSHRSTYLHSMAVCMANTVGLADGDRVLPVVTMFHANAWGTPYAAVMAGADLLMPDRFLQAEPLVDMIEQLRPTIAAAVPTIWNDVLQYLHPNPGRDISSLRTVVCGGSAVRLGMMKAYEERHGVLIRQGWGMTETSPFAAIATPPPEVTAADHWALRATAGRALCGVEIRIVDDSGSVLPNDGKAVGEIEVRGPWITASYYGDDTPEKFDEGWLRTGDVGTINEQGFIQITDRSKDVIKSGGEWISTVELENALMGHPDVIEAAVIGIPDERWDERPLACVVLREGAATDTEALRAFLGERVAKWWVPERWAFISEVPKTSVGKFDKKVLRAQREQGAIEIVDAGTKAAG